MIIILVLVFLLLLCLGVVANMALRATPKVPKEALPVPIGAIPAQEFQTETGPMMAPTNKASLRI